MGNLPPDDSQGVKLIVVIYVFLTSATLATSLRIWARKMKQTALCFNDKALFVALFFAAALVALQTTAFVIGGLGAHVKELRPDEVVVTLKSYSASEILWVSANTCVKLSVLHLYLTIFKTSRSFRDAAYIIMVLVLAFWTAVVVRCFAICRPFAYNWDKKLNGRCGNQSLAYLLTAIFNLILDLSIFSLPLPTLWKLQMPRSKKWMLTGIFSLGLLVCVMTILRIVSVIQLIANNSDFTYSVVDDALWSTLESTLGIITACLPVLGPVLEKTKSIVTRTEKSTKSHDRKLRSDSISAIPLKSWSKDSESNSKNFQRLYEHLDTGPDHFDGTGRPGNSSTVITVTTDLDVQSREQ